MERQILVEDLKKGKNLLQIIDGIPQMDFVLGHGLTCDQ